MSPARAMVGAKRKDQARPTSVEFVGSDFNNTGTGATTSLALTLPTGSEVGDLCIVVGNLQGSGSFTATLSTSGWTLVTNVVNAQATGQMWLWTKTLTGADITSPDVNFVPSASRVCSAALIVVRADQDAITTVPPTQLSNVASVVMPAITPVDDNCLLTWFVATAGIGAGSARSFAPPGGVTELEETWANPAGTATNGCAIYTKQLSGGAGVSSGTQTLTITGGNVHAFVVGIAVQPIVDTTPVVDPPPVPVRPFYRHLPFKNPDQSDIPQSGWLGMTQNGIASGIFTGAAFYSGGTMNWNSTWAAFFAAFPDGVDLFMMPANPAGAVTFLSNLNAAQRNKIMWSNGQEREDQIFSDGDGNPLPPAEQEANVQTFRARTLTLWNEIGAAGWRWDPVTQTGVRCVVEMNGSVTQDGGHEGVPGQIRMVDLDHIDFMGWSCFSPSGGSYATTVCNTVANRMADTWPGMDWGMVAGGINVVPNSPLLGAARVTRANLSDTFFGTCLSRGSQTLALYDVWHFSSGDYGWETSISGGPLVIDTLLEAVLLEHAQA